MRKILVIYCFIHIRRMNCEAPAIENEWIVLDKVVAVAHALGTYGNLGFTNNGKEITLKFKDLEATCGLTHRISKILFARANLQRRRVLEDLGITFPNTGQPWKSRKITVNYQHSPPNLYNRFVTCAAQQREVVHSATNGAGQHKPGNKGKAIIAIPYLQWKVTQISGSAPAGGSAHIVPAAVAVTVAPTAAASDTAFMKIGPVP